MFGCYDIEDIKQEAWLICIDGLNSYNGSHPLENFLIVHLRNRLINFRRNKYRRHTPPCVSCPFYDPKKDRSTSGCTAFAVQTECDKYADWLKKNQSKQSLMTTVTGTPDRAYEDTVQHAAQYTELREKILASVPVTMRSDLLKMLDGVPVSKAKQEAIREAVRDKLGLSLDDNDS